MRCCNTFNDPNISILCCEAVEFWRHTNVAHVFRFRMTSRLLSMKLIFHNVLYSVEVFFLKPKYKEFGSRFNSLIFYDIYGIYLTAKSKKCVFLGIIFRKMKQDICKNIFVFYSLHFNEKKLIFVMTK